MTAVRAVSIELENKIPEPETIMAKGDDSVVSGKWNTYRQCTHFSKWASPFGCPFAQCCATPSSLTSPPEPYSSALIYGAESTTYDSGNHNGEPDLRMLHYNDVYHVEPGSREPVGGVARFKTLSNYYEHDDRFKGQSELLTFFSGDAFNPSLESSITKGWLEE